MQHNIFMETNVVMDNIIVHLSDMCTCLTSLCVSNRASVVLDEHHETMYP